MGGSAKAGGGATQRFNYRAAGAVLICGGKTTALKGIEVRDKWEWTGLLLEADSPNPVQITVPNYGNGLLYWGRDDQVTPADVLQAANNGLGHDHPAYTSCTYFVCLDGWLLGLETRNQPKMRFHTLRTPQQALITGPAAALVDGQANPFAIQAELYTSRRLGRGMPAARFAAATWQAAADAAYANNAATYVSVLLTESTNGKGISQNLNALCDGYLRQQSGTGLCEAGVFTPVEAIDADSLPVIDRHWLTQDPEWDDDTWSDVYSRVIVSYRDRNKNFKTRTERYDDPVAAAMGIRRTKTIKVDEIVRSGQALGYAQKMGPRLAIPGASGKLTVRAEKAIALRPGQHVRVDIDAQPGGAERRKVCRVVKITRAIRRDTVLEVETERQLDAALSTPTTPSPETPPEIVIPEITYFRFFEAPYLLADGEAYHIGLLASRPEAMVTSFRAHYDNVSGGDFPSLGDSRAYALRGKLNTAYADDATGAVSVELLDTLNREIIADNPGGTAARDDTLLMIVLKIAGSGQIAADGEDKAFIEIFSVSEIVAATTDVVDVTALRSRLGTPARSFPEDAEVWFIRRDALAVMGHADFPDLAAAEEPAYFKLQPSGPLGTRPIEDCIQREFSFALVRELPPDVVDDGVTPDPVSAVTVEPGLNTVWFTYTLPGNTPLRKIRIYESLTTTKPGSPSFTVSGAQNFAVREGLPSGVLRYYWLDAEGTNGRVSSAVGPYNATTINLELELPDGSSVPTVVDTLPSTGNFKGRLVFLTTDNKLYRWTNDVIGTGTTYWTAEIAAADVSGTLSDAQIAALAASKITGTLSDSQLAAIAAAKITGTLSDSQLAAIASTKITGTLSDSQLAAIAAAKITGTLTSAQIADLAATKITGTLSDSQIAALAAAKLTGQITQTQITDGSISTSKLAAASIVADKIASDAITADKIVANAVTAAKIEAGAITTAKIAAGAVTADEIASNAITSAKINTGAITTAKLAADAVTANELAANAVTAAKINAGAITTAKIAAGAVTAGEIAADAITAVKLSAGSVETAKIASDAVVADKIATNAVTAAKVEAGSITTAKLAAGAVVADKIAAGSITTSKLLIVPVSLCPDPFFADEAWWTETSFTTNKWYFEVNSLSDFPKYVALWSGHPTNNPGSGEGIIESGNVTAPAAGSSIRFRASISNSCNQAITAMVRFVSLTGTPLYDVELRSAAASGNQTLSVIEVVPVGAAYMRFIILNDGGTLFSGSVVVAGIMLDLAASSELVVDGAITADKLTANSVTAGKIAAGAIETDKLAANAVVADKIATNAIVADKINANAVTTAKILAGAVTAEKLTVTQLDAITATIGTLQTATSGARTKIQDNLIQVFDSSNIARVELGILS